MVDHDRLHRTWAQVIAYGDQVALRFYSRLFLMAPETRDMFPLSMATQRDRLLAALGHTVANVAELERVVPYLQQLGRDHRKFGVEPHHYGPLGEALLATLADFLGHEWTPDLAHDWAEAYGLVARVMIEAAEQAAHHVPARWDAEVVAHERRTFDIAVLTIRPEPRYDYVAGQSMAVEIPQRPRLWRYFSPANAPREDGSIDLHVRRRPGGHVSSGLVDKVGKGDVLHLGSPVGHRLTLPPGTDAPLLLIAGGTGLAPLKALVEQVAHRTRVGEHPRRVALFFGARTARELYDLEALQALDAEHPWLTVVPALADDPYADVTFGEGASARRVEHGDVGEVALAHGPWHDHEVYVCGGDEMVAATVLRLQGAGCPAERIHYEGFQGLGGEEYGVVDPGGRHQQ
ncbi:MAG TPA: globin domain-containing protein [Acidimicrobiales bacterium]